MIIVVLVVTNFQKILELQRFALENLWVALVWKNE